MVPNIDGLITALSSDREITDLQGKLYREMSKIEAWLMRKYMTPLVCSPQNMICSVCSLPYSITSRNVLQTSMFASKHDLLHVFFTLPDHLKKGYVLQMLRHGV